METANVIVKHTSNEIILSSHQPKCRFCNTELHTKFVSLGMQPLCQDHIKPGELNQMEPHYPLEAYVCETCYLVQLEEFVSPDKIFNDYAYFSSYSSSWLAHAEAYSAMMIEKLPLGAKSFVAEIASNDGYLLQFFKKKGIPVLGIEPAENVARHAIREKNIPTEIKFFGVQTAHYLNSWYPQPDLLIGNNVLAHVPNINDFVEGIRIFLKPAGVLTLEFPHLQKLIEQNQFDTIYHEHFSYLSFTTVTKILRHHGLEVFDIQELGTHGGSLRVFVKHEENENLPVSTSVPDLLEREHRLGFSDITFYQSFQEKVKNTKRKLLECLIQIKKEGKTIAGYGAPGKGNTLLNYCGIRTDFIDYTVDRNPHKQGNYLPGSMIPIFAPERIHAIRPDFLFVLPWNLKSEIMEQMSGIRDWGGKFIIPIPEPEIL